MRLLRLVVGLMVGIGALALGVRGIAQAGETADRCVRLIGAAVQPGSALTDSVFARGTLIDGTTGSSISIPAPRQITNSEAGSYSPDGRYQITTRSAGDDTYLEWIQAYPPRTTSLAAGHMKLYWWQWSPDSSLLTYLLRSPDLGQANERRTTWNVLHTLDGRIDTIQLTPGEVDAFFGTSLKNVALSPDGKTIAVVSNSADKGTMLRLRAMNSGSEETVDLSRITNAILTWAPDSRTLMLIGGNPAYPSQIQLAFYSLADRQLVERTTEDKQRKVSRVFDPLNLVWAPNSRYFYAEGTDLPLRMYAAGLDIYGVDGSAYFDVAPGLANVMWLRTGAQLLFQDQTMLSLGRDRLVVFDAETGETRTFQDNASIALKNNQVLQIRYVQEGGEIVLDSLNLQTWKQTHLIHGITRLGYGYDIAPKWSPVPSPFVAVPWYQGNQFYLSIITPSGDMRRDFSGLQPDGILRDLGDSSHFLYELRVNGNTQVAIYLLNFQTGTINHLLDSASNVWTAYVDSDRQLIHLGWPAQNALSWRVFSNTGDLLPLGSSEGNDQVSVSPDGKRGVRWHMIFDSAAQPSPIELLAESGAARFLPRQGIDVLTLSAAWSSDGVYFALKYADSGVPRNIRVDVFTANGDFVSTTTVMGDVGYDQIEWGRCG